MIEKTYDQLRRENIELLLLIYNAALGEVAMGFSADVESMAESAFNISGINSSEAYLESKKIK